MSSLQQAARRAPLPVKRVLRRAMQPIDVLARSQFSRTHPNADPIPPLSLRLRIGMGTSIPYYFSSGAAVADVIESTLAEAGKALDTFAEVLDLGCGCGRVASHLASRHPDLRFHGCDVDSEAIAWAAENIPDAAFKLNRFEPPLEFGDRSFDLLYSVSLFTHLAPSLQVSWIREVRRVLAPGGWAILTTCGPAMLAQFHRSKTASNSAKFTRRVRAIPELAGEPDPVFVPYVRGESNRSQFEGIEGDYGLTFQTEEQTRRLWGAELRVGRVLGGAINEGQDLVMLERPG